jgi:phthiocerol/phenolphthiocerol synthesis type-I polyketide synthase C
LIAADRRFDAVVAPGHILESSVASLSQVVCEGGLVLGILPEKSRLFEILPPLTLAAKPSSSSCLAALKSSFRAVESIPFLPSTGMGPSIAMAAAPVAAETRHAPARKTLVLPLGDGAKFEAESLAAALEGVCELLPPLENEAARIWIDLLSREEPGVVVFVSANENTAHSAIDELAALSSFFKALAANLPHVEVVIVTKNALAGTNRDSWMGAGLWGFARVARNEFSQFRIRCIDRDGSGADPAKVQCLANEISSRDTEDEVRLTPTGRLVARVSLEENSRHISADAVLDFDSPGPFQNLKWKPASPREPGPDEVEIEVRAAGLNFRDVMFAMGLLPDEALEGGFAGPTLGMELSGTVVSAGPGAERFQPGDEVIAFASASFAKRAITSISAVMPKPPGISFEAGATIPAAFFTAWHALVDLAGLRRGERVLIHGAAGGVGIAAIQIARWIGAEIFATAGTADKRDFVRLLGADHIFDSRSLDFAEEILAATGGEGVDVVLNSLAGEAVAKNLEILRPFGRFLELGKRDFYENTRIALRPFRNNIRYFGVDADQLMAIRPDEAAAAFEKLMHLFEQGVLTPLPYKAFEAADAAEAFRHMQHSGHTGKIVLRLEDIPLLPQPKPSGKPAFDKNGTYLVTGGTTGFGLQTAKWLVEHGAGALVLASRRGAVEDKALDFLAEARASGVQVLAEPCDVTDPQALETLLERVRSSMPPLRGVFHAAMVLNDSLIVNSDSTQIESVLLPKIAGAANLDKLTRRDSLDHFVMYSSATTLFGNPGQAFYVAANAALEELAARRRAQGLPSTCIAWGPIGDTGYLSRNQQVKEALAARTGGQPLESRDALRFLGQALSTSASGMAWMDLDWGSLSRFLPSAGTPRFQSLSQSLSSSHTSDHSPDLRRELELLERPELVETLKGILREEISTILRVPAAKLDENKSLLEIGMDSLMGVELMTSLENSLGITIPMMALSEAPTIAKLSERLSHAIKPTEEAPAEPEDSVASQVRALAKQHGVDEVEDSEMATIAESLGKSGTA